MHSHHLSVSVSAQLVSEIREYFRHEANTLYSDDAILAALNWWLESRIDDLYEEIGEVLMSPHLAESQRFREILEAPERQRVSAAALSQSAAAITEPHQPSASAPTDTSIFNGFRDFSPARLGAMIEHIVRSGHDIYKTNLNKLLFYADLTNYHLRRQGISGATYVNMPYGPVPDQVERVIDHLAAVGRVTRSSVQGLGRNVQMIKPGATPESEVLTGDEKRVIDWVMDQYGDLSPSQISDLSHKEKAYASTRPGEQIAYEYAKFLANLPKT
jgi:uncharacterized phage-associated protein